MKLNPDIQSLFDTSIHQLTKIKSEYANTIKKGQAISPSLQIYIKNFLENTRSILDYLANQIFSENCSTKKDDVYFPLYCKDKHAFESFMKKGFTDLETTNISLYSKLESIQYYKDPVNNEWMKDLRLVNENKHKKLSEQSKQHSNEGMDIGTTDGTFFRIGKEANLTLSNLSLGNVGINHAEFSHDKPAPDIEGLIVRKTIQDEYHFNKLSKPVIPTLERILSGVMKVIKIIENTP